MAAHSDIVVLAGPNGAGKSTLATGLLQGALAVRHFVNADVIASGLSGFDPDKAALLAVRIMIQRLEELAAKRESLPSKRRWEVGRSPRSSESSFLAACVFGWFSFPWPVPILQSSAWPIESVAVAIQCRSR